MTIKEQSLYASARDVLFARYTEMSPFHYIFPADLKFNERGEGQEFNYTLRVPIDKMGRLEELARAIYIQHTNMFLHFLKKHAVQWYEARKEVDPVRVRHFLDGARGFTQQLAIVGTWWGLEPLFREHWHYQPVGDGSAARAGLMGHFAGVPVVGISTQPNMYVQTHWKNEVAIIACPGPNPYAVEAIGVEYVTVNDKYNFDISATSNLRLFKNDLDPIGFTILSSDNL